MKELHFSMNTASHKMGTHDQPKISIISPSLNTGEFLRETIESVFNQTFTNHEYIVIDGGSTDDTIDILKEYPRIRWISEKEESDNPILDAIWKGISMANGEYITYLSISDGFLDRMWFEKCVDILERDPEVSAVWGVYQEMSEDGHLGQVAFQEFLKECPPQKMEFLPFWLIYRQDIESNAIFRRNVFETCFTRNDPNDPYRFFPHCGLNYRFNTLGYLPYFLPLISFYARTHKNQRQEKYYNMLDSVSKMYDRELSAYRKKFLSREITHQFRNGSSEIIKEVAREELFHYRKKLWEYRIKRRWIRNFQKILDHL